MIIAGRTLIVVLTVMVIGSLSHGASAQQIEVVWLGHSAFRITSVTGKVIVIDPFLKKNPQTPAKYRDLAALGKVDLILVTHGHGDHVDDLSELARMTGAIVVAQHGLALQLVALGLLDNAKTITMNKGGLSRRSDRASRCTWCPPCYAGRCYAELERLI
jgi:L-ascorbate metabolism protein UlaG (beta-lactamase superfamily)